jgi:hypothetical protein
MPTIPHSYTLKHEWEREKDFLAADQAVRDFGYPTKFYNRDYIYWDIDGYHHWSLPQASPIIKLINRAKKPYPRPTPFSPSSSVVEAQVMHRLAAIPIGKCLQVGIPDTGTILPFVKILPDNYCCIDTRSLAISQAEYDHPEYDGCFIRSCLSDHYRDGYDTIVALYGSASNIPVEVLSRIPFMLNSGGIAILMFRDDDKALVIESSDVQYHTCIVRKIGADADLSQDECP